MRVPVIICCFSSCTFASKRLYSSGRYWTHSVTVLPAPCGHNKKKRHSVAAAAQSISHQKSVYLQRESGLLVGRVFQIVAVD